MSGVPLLYLVSWTLRICFLLTLLKTEGWLACQRVREMEIRGGGGVRVMGVQDITDI